MISYIVQHIRRPHNSSNFDKHVMIVLSVEKWFSFQNDSSHHCPKTPNVKRVTVLHVVGKKFRAFEIPWCNSHVIILSRKVILGKSKVNELCFLSFLVNYNIERLDISMHDSSWVKTFKSKHDLVKYELSRVWIKVWVHFSERTFLIPNVFSDQYRAVWSFFKNELFKLDHMRNILKFSKNGKLSLNFL